MSTNPYAPPTAAVADVRPDGRLNRLRYVAWLTAGYFLFALGVLVSAALGQAAMFVVEAVAFVIAMLWSIQRAHDMGWSGWSCLATLVPFVVLVWVFKPGVPGRNEYGAPPPPNTLGVKILGAVFPVVFFLSIVPPIVLFAQYALRSGHV